MSYGEEKERSQNLVLNKYMGNKNYEKNFYSELFNYPEKTGDEKKDLESWRSSDRDFQQKRNEIEKTKPRYSSKEDISTLEYRQYEREVGEEDFKYLELNRNFISDVELDDLKHLMVMVNDHITENVDIENDVPQVERLMKSLVRIVHRFNYTRGHSVPVVETMQSRDVMTII